MEILEKLSENLISGQDKIVEKLVQKALNENISANEILQKGLIKGMDVVGEKFKNNEFYIPEVLIAARAMKAGMTLLKPSLVKTGVKPVGKMVIGTIKGDLHDIGKNLVAMMMEGAGFEIYDLTVDVSPEKFIEKVKETNAKLIGMSALLTTTMVNMKATIDALKENNLREKVKVIIGGAPVTQEFADEIGADAFAPDAASAVEKVKELIK
ncbi:cobalamin-binding protein [candidate division KSB1 bacterium]|nr:MAG: cobalamin-binding protein [candidate division KSB1 bacterium]